MTIAAILAAITALLTFLYKLPEIKAAFSKSPEENKEAVDQAIQKEEDSVNQSGRPPG